MKPRNEIIIELFESWILSVTVKMTSIFIIESIICVRKDKRIHALFNHLTSDFIESKLQNGWKSKRVACPMSWTVEPSLWGHEEIIYKIDFNIPVDKIASNW